MLTSCWWRDTMQSPSNFEDSVVELHWECEEMGWDKGTLEANDIGKLHSLLAIWSSYSILLLVYMEAETGSVSWAKAL